MRPYVTHYFHDAADRDPAAYVSQGHPVTEAGAVRAAVVRVFLGEYGKAIVYRRSDMVPVYNISRRQSKGAYRPQRLGGPIPQYGIHIGYGSGINFKEYEKS